MSAGTCLSSSGDRIRIFLLLFSRYVLSLSHSFPHLVSCSFRVESVQNYTHLFTIARVRDVRGCTCSCFTCANDEARGIRREPQRTNMFCFCILAIDAAESVCGPEDTMGQVEGKGDEQRPVQDRVYV
jgi:hypothetical protein